MTFTNVRHLRRVAPPLASYLRVGQRDVSLMGKLLDQGFTVGAGLIVDPSAVERTAEMRDVAVENGVEVILDTRGVELSTIGGLAMPSVAKLRWAATRPYTPSDLSAARGAVVASLIAETAIAQKVTGVLAHTHLLDQVDPWLDVDANLVGELRIALDSNGAGSTSIYYPLIAPLQLLRDEPSIVRIIDALQVLVTERKIDGIFLRVQGFGTRFAGPRNLRSYINVARGLHGLGVPLVAERTGCVGVALAAFGAVGGVESSVTYGEAYDARRLKHESKGKGFLPPPRVYISGAMLTIPVEQARAIFTRRGFGRLACDRSCCRGGREATLQDPRRHFVVTRAAELSDMSAIPSSERPENFLTRSLTPARETSAQIARFDSSFEKHRNRLDDWNLALRHTLAADRLAQPTVAIVPTGHRLLTGA